MKRNLSNLKVILAGMLATQAIGTVHVFLSNRNLLQSLRLIQKAGYLAVPNEHVWASLQGFKAAFLGGLFFTLSIGTGLSLFGLVCAWIWIRVFSCKKAALTIFLILWLWGIVAANGNGINLLATLYLVCVPAVSFLSALLWFTSDNEGGERFKNLAYLAVPVFLILLFIPLGKKSIFLDIRDNLLLNNPIGRNINNFYYDYTLYAAQAIKSLEQKTLRTCRLELADKEQLRPAMVDILIAHDYLVLDEDEPVDLYAKEEGNNLALMSGGKIVLTTTLEEFTKKPSFILQQFSQQTDRFRSFRLGVFLSMAVGAPLCLYIILQGLFFLVLGLFLDNTLATLFSLLLCILIGIAIALPLYEMKALSLDAESVVPALKSKNWKEHVAAWRYIEQHGLNAEMFANETHNILKSPSIAERYWYVRMLGTSKSPAAVNGLLAALDDASINVVCMALWGLGQKGDDSVIREIRKRMEQSTCWYEQWYGYRALRALGWQQHP